MFEPPLRIRDFHSKDLETLHKIDRLCFPADIAFTRRDFLHYLGMTDSVTRVAEMTGGVAGFILGSIEDGCWGRIITLDVVPRVQRRGIGLALMEDFHRIMKKKKIRAVTLEVGTDNLVAQRLYEKMEYRLVETLPGYYNGKADAYRMLRTV